MALNREVFLDALESGFSLVPGVPGKLEWLSIPGVRVRVTPISHVMANIVSGATLNENNVDETIARIIEFYTTQKKAFSWVVGPRTTPSDLGEHLLAAGLEKIMDMAGMVQTDLTTPIRTNPDVTIREATPDDIPAVSRTMARGFPNPDDLSQLYTSILFSVRDKLKIRQYLAFLGDEEEPVATCTMTYFPNQPIIRLAGAATLKEHRRKGIYSSMVARRLMDAHKDGIKAAVIEAKTTTSAPVCRNLGFKEICTLQMYTWNIESDKT
jgi:N-acetylglutamate synthase-like GNAT family acetyltransferase